MIRIIHFSDFHFNKHNLEDWNYFIKDSLTSELKRINEAQKIDLIFLTGDLIDKGGISFSSIDEAFTEFKKNIIDPILSSIHLPKEKFLIIPGNHDLNKKLEEEWEDEGLKQFLSTQEKIQAFIKKGKDGDYKGFERIKAFKSFEEKLYSGILNCQLSPFDSNFILDIHGRKIGISCLNSSWRCFDSKKDKGSIIVGDTQIANANQFISDCDIKIALIHHPYDWISEVERTIIHHHLHNNFNMMFIGHVHEGETSVETNFAGSLFVNVAPGALTDIRSDSRKYSNGFVIVDYQDELQTVTCSYKRYNHNNRRFVDNTDLGDNGKSIFDIPLQKRLKQISSIQDHLKTITDVRFDEMNEHLISTGSELGPKTIKECFVLPNISQQLLIDEKKDDAIENRYLSLQDILNSENDLLFFGTKECGKTILLFRLVHEYVDRFEFKKTLPVYLDFLEIGNREIENCIKSYLSCGSDDLDAILQNRDIVLLLDNIQWDNTEFQHQIRKLSNFRKKYDINKKNKRIKIIATATSDISGVIPSDFELPLFNFEIYFIENLHTAQIRGLISKWAPIKGDGDIDKRLEKIVSNFKSFALPRTAMSVSLFLWTMENKDRKPINNATLLDIFLEIVLEKIHGEEIYRERFDVENKMMLLGHIAAKMLERKLENYCLPYADLVKVVDDYLTKEVGFEFDSQRLVDYFLNRKIFMKFQRNRVKFRYSCFFQFFLAKRMVYDADFKDYIIQEINYHNFVGEIELYTGLVRSDKALLKEFHERFTKEFKPYQNLLKTVNIDTHFNTERPIIKKLSIDNVRRARPSEEFLEKQTDKILESLPNPEIIFNREQRKTLEILLVIMANTLRNLEGVEDLKLKRAVYEDIINNTLIFILLYQFVLIEYYKRFNSLPPNVPKDYNLSLLLRNIPFHVQAGMSYHLATIKLAPTILDKIINDNQGKSITGTDIEKFLSVFLYADIQGHDYTKYLNKFIKSVKNNAVMDYTFYKLWEYSITRAKPGSTNEETFIELLATLKLKTEDLPNKLKDQVLRTLRRERRIDPK